jgi:hypothetical protein
LVTGPRRAPPGQTGRLTVGRKLTHSLTLQFSFPLALRVVRGDGNGTQCPGVYLGQPVPGGYKYGDLVLQVCGVSDETVKYGREFCATALARPSSNSKLQTRLLVKESATK